jgi:hypothetical protein
MTTISDPFLTSKRLFGQGVLGGLLAPTCPWKYRGPGRAERPVPQSSPPTLKQETSHEKNY